MSESQQGPEICDVISRKRYLRDICFITLQEYFYKDTKH